MLWKMDAHTQPNHHPTKMDLLPKTFVNPLVTRRHICAAKKEKIPVQLFIFQY